MDDFGLAHVDLFGLPLPVQKVAKKARARWQALPGAVDVVSYGGGMQSAAMAALIIQGELPRPERIVMCDTGFEASAVWRYLDTYVQPALAEIGMEVEIARSADYAKKGLIGGKRSKTLLTPAYSTQGHQTDGKWPLMPHYCSVEWKRRVFRRYLHALGYGPNNKHDAPGRTPGPPIRVWLGFSTDERDRQEFSDVAWAANSFPLLYERPTARAECPSIVARLGWPEPPKSACYFCALRSNAEFLAMRDSEHAEDREDFERAVAYDYAQRDGSLGLPPDPDKYLHRSGKPLDEVDFSAAPDLFERETCNTGHCFV